KKIEEEILKICLSLEENKKKKRKKYYIFRLWSLVHFGITDDKYSIFTCERFASLNSFQGFFKIKICFFFVHVSSPFLLNISVFSLLTQNFEHPLDLYLFA
ncbi:MAG: hypothetical protein RBR08_16090, partial [Desulforegulaceae bacterium]|nr:hypothetical protein [Desulforegulaceae bacterium]